MNELNDLNPELQRQLLGLLASAGMGFLIGMEREHAKKDKEREEQFAGVRTHTLVAIFGFLSAMLAAEFNPWILIAALAGLSALLAVSYFRISGSLGQYGGTSEISVFLTFLLGAVVLLDYYLLAIAATVAILVLLTYKPSIHRFVKGLSSEEIRAIVQFIIISALVIPFLPEKNFGPYEVWNLIDIWKMVVLVSGISLIGYLLSKVLGNRGTMVAGIVGGLASSTAVSLSFSRRSKESNTATPALAVGILAACSIMFPRILLEVFAINRGLLKYVALPLAVVFITGALAAWLNFRKVQSGSSTENMQLQNPLNFYVALRFALIYAVIIWLVKFASDQFGSSGIYLASIISGITDVDAITISMAQLAKNGDPGLSANAIVLAALSNTGAKMIFVLSMGSVALRKAVLPGFVSILAAGIILFVIMLLFN